MNAFLSFLLLTMILPQISNAASFNDYKGRPSSEFDHVREVVRGIERSTFGDSDGFLVEDSFTVIDFWPGNNWFESGVQLSDGRECTLKYNTNGLFHDRSLPYHQFGKGGVYKAQFVAEDRIICEDGTYIFGRIVYSPIDSPSKKITESLKDRPETVVDSGNTYTVLAQ